MCAHTEINTNVFAVAKFSIILLFEKGAEKGRLSHHTSDGAQTGASPQQLCVLLSDVRATYGRPEHVCLLQAAH